MTKLKNIDQQLILFFAERVPRNPFVTLIAKIINLIGNGGVMWILLAFYLMATPYRSAAYMIFLADLFYFLIGQQLIKRFVTRKRPFQDLPHLKIEVKQPTTSSFPSGHVTISMAVTTILFLTNPWYGFWALIVTLIVAYSRLYLLLHYPSDVLAGLVIGSFFGLLAYFLIA